MQGVNRVKVQSWRAPEMLFVLVIWTKELNPVLYLWPMNERMLFTRALSALHNPRGTFWYVESSQAKLFFGLTGMKVLLSTSSQVGLHISGAISSSRQERNEKELLVDACLKKGWDRHSFLIKRKKQEELCQADVLNKPLNWQNQRAAPHHWSLQTKARGLGRVRASEPLGSYTYTFISPQRQPRPFHEGDPAEDQNCIHSPLTACLAARQKEML